ncbi:hypothetical protein JR316_0007625 [Psilocybe cubensis]|uniref:Uncharacterized protein n=1 Tax=Psilocybe cubensis TaxID=181762 RepID=A0ACB8GTJ9_PSICU|nr:hypothetical protein JR316_0007625 [Psilocybe cubensis]KAH9479050.1 hypothetical protein JR316_0007625 [Psilocybe cubensis]
MFPTANQTMGSTLGPHNREQQTVKDQCSGDHPVEHDCSERNAHGSAFQRIINANKILAITRSRGIYARISSIIKSLKPASSIPCEMCFSAGLQRL